MLIPVILTDLSELADGALSESATPRFTFRVESAARGVLQQLLAEQQQGRLELAAGTSLLLVPRTVTIEAESFDAAAAAGYRIDYTTVQAAWAQSEAAVKAPVVEAPAETLAEPVVVEGTV